MGASRGTPSGAGVVQPVSAAQLADAVGESLIVTDPSGSILIWNKVAGEMYGWSADEVSGHNVIELTQLEQAADQAAQVMEQLRAGNIWNGERKVRRRDGSAFTAQLTHTPVRADDGVLVAVISVSIDAIEEQRARELAASEHRFRALVETSGDLFAITDVDGVIAFAAGPTEALLGIPEDALAGTSIFALVHPADVGRPKARWAKRLAAVTPMPAEDYWTRNTDGNWLCMSTMVANNLIDDPDVGGVVMTVRDVTARKILEQERTNLRGITTAMAHATSEADLFDAICKVVVGNDTYHLAWIGLADATQSRGVRMVAAGGSAAAFFDALEHLEGDDIRDGPVATSLATHEISAVQDVAALPETVPWRSVALAYGCSSMVVLPLVLSEDDFGVPAIYAGEPNVFNDETVDLLGEFAAELANGIDALRTRAQRSSFRARYEAGLEAVVRAVATAAELRDPYTAGHQRRVAELAAAVAAEMGIDSETAAGIVVAASIHDIGKPAMPAEILSKPGRLSDTEYALIKEHARAGCDIIAGIDFPWPVSEMILQHHERLDGSGYPNGIGGRILAVADVVEAMQAHRPYRPGLGLEAALETIDAGRATLFDPDVVDTCTRLLSERGFAFTV